MLFCNCVGTFAWLRSNWVRYGDPCVGRWDWRGRVGGVIMVAGGDGDTMIKIRNYAWELAGWAGAEELERRQLLSAWMTKGTLMVDGTNRADVIVVSDSGKGTVTVTINGNKSGYGEAGVKKIQVRGLNGNDEIEMRGYFPRGVSVYGNGGRDRIVGGPSNEMIWGGAGDDELLGGKGDDKLYGEGGEDYLDGGSGDDLLVGGNDADLLKGRDGDDTLYGGEGDDGLLGGSGNDELYGEDDNDYLNGGGGDDYLNGGLDDDLLQDDDGDNVLNGGKGDDTIYR